MFYSSVKSGNVFCQWRLVHKDWWLLKKNVNFCLNITICFDGNWGNSFTFHKHSLEWYSVEKLSHAVMHFCIHMNAWTGSLRAALREAFDGLQAYQPRVKKPRQVIWVANDPLKILIYECCIPKISKAVILVNSLWAISWAEICWQLLIQ